MKVTLIRHTRVAVPAGTCYGNSDVDVAGTFPEEAEQVRAGLKGLCFDGVFTSPSQRCRKLAAFCGFPDARPDDRLKELNFGSWEGQLWHEIKDPLLGEWYENWMGVRAGGGESFLEQYTRVASFLDELAEGDFRHVCVFAHSGTIRAALVYARHYPLNRAFEHEVDFGSRRTLEIY